MNGNAASAGYGTAAWNYNAGSMPAPAILSIDAGANVMDAGEAAEKVKRCIDVALAFLAIAVTLPLWGIIALAIKLTSRGPVFFTQERSGLFGRPFRMFKFRSMVADAEDRLRELVKIEELADPVYKLKNDPRVTPVGRFLRRFGLDELPQLLNVLRGEMSLVGPRPEVVALVERYDARQRRRLLVKPGITGYQQVHNRGMPNMTERLKYDLYYLHNRSAPLDFWIMAMTVFVIASGREITY